jgi:hypothetical protein
MLPTIEQKHVARMPQAVVDLIKSTDEWKPAARRIAALNQNMTKTRPYRMTS